MRIATKCILLLALCAQPYGAQAHPLRLSLSEIEYSDDKALLNISLRLFLMDVNEALVFDPNSRELAFCEPNESPNAERLLLEYLNEYFHVIANGQKVDLNIQSKRLAGEGINIALGVDFEHQLEPPLKTLEIKNAVFTDLFFDQSNVVYIHVNDESDSLMLNIDTPVHQLSF